MADGSFVAFTFGRNKAAMTEVIDNAKEQFDQQGWLLTDGLNPADTDRIRSWVDEISAWPDTLNAWLHYREATDTGPALCRTENFVPYHEKMRKFLTEGPMLATAGLLLGEPAVLYKEKINYKLAGGAGYSPHQDAPAYRFIEIHISCLVAIDDSTLENGCLEVASGVHQEILPTDETGCINPAVAKTLNWAPVELKAGQTLWFHSRTPHRSGPNHSESSRRAIYPTYNARSEGDLRTEYYEQKLSEFDETGDPDGRVQVSLIGDFQGRPVE